MKDLSDEELVRRLTRGDEKALSELYDRYSRPVYRTGLRLLGDTSLAEDLVQDAFTRVWTSAETFDSSRASFATWLYRIARNRTVDLDRRRRARPSTVGPEMSHDISGDPGPEANVNGWDVAEALSRIPDRHREILTMTYYEGLSQREISRRTGLPLGTVKSRTTAALKRLRHAMGDPRTQETRSE